MAETGAEEEKDRRACDGGMPDTPSLESFAKGRNGRPNLKKPF